MNKTIIENVNKHKKDLSLEIMRIIAAIFVIFNHTGKMGFLLFTQYKIGSFLYWVYMPISIFCKFSVPLFFMISGALLLGKDEDIKTVLKKRVLRNFVTLFAFSVIYFVWKIIIGYFPFSPFDNLISFFIMFCSGKVDELLWFLYSYIVFLLLLPFLRNAVKNMKNQEYIYLFVLSFVVMIITPLCNSFLFNNQNMFSDFEILTTQNMVYPLLGYYLYNVADISRFKLSGIIITWVINLSFIIVSCILTYIRMCKTGNTKEDYSFYYMFMMFNCFTIFVTIKNFVQKHLNKEHKIIYSIGSCTMGVYLFQGLIISNPFINELLDYILPYSPHPIISVSLYCIATFFLCFIVTYILKHIPVIKNYL